eukprot:1653157-Rhodomonas_salina.2
MSADLAAKVVLTQRSTLPLGPAYIQVLAKRIILPVLAQCAMSPLVPTYILFLGCLDAVASALEQQGPYPIFLCPSYALPGADTAHGATAHFVPTVLLPGIVYTRLDGKMKLAERNATLTRFQGTAYCPPTRCPVLPVCTARLQPY